MVALRSSVGPYASPLGLDLMGSIAGRGWSDGEAALLEEGMRLVGRDFRFDSGLSEPSCLGDRATARAALRKWACVLWGHG